MKTKLKNRIMYFHRLGNWTDDMINQQLLNDYGHIKELDFNMIKDIKKKIKPTPSIVTAAAGLISAGVFMSMLGKLLK